MRILVTGGGGFLGSHVGDLLLSQGHEVFALDTAKDLKVRHNLGNPRFHYVKDSIFSKDMLESLVRRCEVVYHLAAVVGVEHYVEDPYSVLNVNINGTQSVLRLAHAHGNLLALVNVAIGLFLHRLGRSAPAARAASWLAVAGLLMPLGIAMEAHLGASPFPVLPGGAAAAVSVALCLGIAVGAGRAGPERPASR